MNNLKVTRKLLLIFLGIFLIGTISPYYAGESFILDFPEFDNLNVDDIEIINNTYNLDGFNYSVSGTSIYIAIDDKFQPDNFTMLVKGQKIKIISNSGSGSSSRKRNCEWLCSNWTTCDGYTTNRNCTNTCGKIKDKPSVSKYCSDYTEEVPVVSDGGGSAIQDPLIEDNKGNWLWWLSGILALIFLLLLLYLIYYSIKRKKIYTDERGLKK